MDFRLVFALVSGLACVSLFKADTNVLHMAQDAQEQEIPALKDDDIGKLNSCVDVGKNPFYFQWKPRVFRPKKTTYLLNISIPIKHSAFNQQPIRKDLLIESKKVEEYKTANACVIIKLKGIEDPIYYDCGTLECTKVAQYLDKIFRDFKCPLKAVLILKKVLPFPVDPSIPLPAGDYILRVELNTTAGKKIVCLEGDVSIDDQ